MVQSTSSSGIFFGSTSNSLPHEKAGQFSGDVGNTVLNIVSTPGPSIEASSLVTDANSGLSGGPDLQRSASTNTESYMRLPASPISFSSNNISMDGSSVVQQTSNSNQIRKKPRLDIKQEDVVQQQVLQQILQRQALIQQQRLRQQEQLLMQGMTEMQRAQFLQQNQHLQLRQQIQVQGMPPASAGNRPYDGGVCSRRLMQYLYHKRQRPADNTIAYWRKFVAEYYSPLAKKRWCLSLYDNPRHHSVGVFHQSAMGAWQCDICGSKSGKGFEATFEVLPRLCEVNFGSGLIDELLFLDLPREYRFPSGIMMLIYAKAVQESVYDQLRVVREGQLRILFTPDLKILSWEFCARRHEELLPRRLVAPQVNQLLQVAQKCQSTISESGPDGVSQPDLKSNSLMIITAGRQLARSLELQSLNDLGFSKSYVRCLQVADVVNSMKDLMDFCREHQKGPIEGLKNFPRRSVLPKVEIDHTGGLLNNLMASNIGLNNKTNNNNQYISSRGAFNGSPQSSIALTNYQKLLTRQNSMNSTNSPIQHEPSSSYQAQSSITSRFLPEISQNGLLQQQTVQQYLHNMGRMNNGMHTLTLQNQGENISGPGLGFGNGPCVGQSQQSSRSNSFKAASSESEAPAPGGMSRKASDLTGSCYLTDEMVSDIGGEFVDDGFFDDVMDFGWKV